MPHKPIVLCRLILSCALLIASAPLVAADGLSDEAIVRATYTKFALEFQMEALRAWAFEGIGEPQAPPKFTFSDWVSGALSEIASMAIGNWITKPSGDVLDVGTENWSVNDGAGPTAYAHLVKASWTIAPERHLNWSMPMSDVIKYMGPDYPRYVGYTVTIDFQGRQRTYKAMFFFGRDASGKPKVFAADHVTSTTLNNVIPDEIVLDPLLLPIYTRRPAVADFLDSIQNSPGCSIDPIIRMCCDDRGEVCQIPFQIGTPR